MKGTKSDSGAQKRKRKKAEDKLLKSQEGAMLKHLKKEETISTVLASGLLCEDSEQEHVIYHDVLAIDNTADKTEETTEGNGEDQEIINLEKNNVLTVIQNTNQTEINAEASKETKHDENMDVSHITVTELEITNADNAVDWNDIGCWPLSLNNQQRDFVVKLGPIRIVDFDFPERNGRRFLTAYYSRKLCNRETLDRRWLVYSVKQNRVYCFCCKLFSNSFNSFSSHGYDNWKNFLAVISLHETSCNHITAQKNWIEMENRMNLNLTIDKEAHRLMNAERMHWRGVLERLLAIIHFLAKNNLAFRGTDEHLNCPNNGNFLGLVELLAKFDPVLHEHLRRINNSEIHDHYLGKNMQDEFLLLISQRVLKEIVASIVKSKYYSVMLDCTPDISHQEQMTLIIRYVEVKDQSVNIVERFVGFIPAEESTGIGLVNAFLQKLDEVGLSITNCRGQGYDNGANMRGCNKGVQSRILRMNNRALFVPCGCHSLNLLLGDMAKSSVIAKSFFGIVQQIYVLFSASVQRWQILKQHVKNLTVKPLSDTRWECKVDSVKAIRYQIGDIYDALVEVSETANDEKCRTEAHSLAKELKSFTFLVTLSIWYEILSKINFLSKTMQRDNIELDFSLELLQKLNEFLISFKENGFQMSEIAAKELAKELEMSDTEMVFPTIVSLRRKRVKKQFSYESEDESVQDPREKYRIGFFNVLMDQAIMSFNERFEHLAKFTNNFGFLFKISDLKNRDDTTLRKHCINLHELLSDHSDDNDSVQQPITVNDSVQQPITENSEIESDIEELNLFTELKMLTFVVPEDASPLDVLKYIYTHRLHEVFPNVTTALRILLTIPVTVASAERSFSKLKLIKTYLRSTMTQDRLVRLALISIENDIASSLDYASLIDEFASIKCRKFVL